MLLFFPIVRTLAVVPSLNTPTPRNGTLPVPQKPTCLPFQALLNLFPYLVVTTSWHVKLTCFSSFLCISEILLGFLNLKINLGIKIIEVSFSEGWLQLFRKISEYFITLKMRCNSEVGKWMLKRKGEEVDQKTAEASNS